MAHFYLTMPFMWFFVSLFCLSCTVNGISINSWNYDQGWSGLSIDGCVKTGSNYQRYGGSTLSSPLCNVKYITSTQFAWHALLNDGTVKTWGMAYTNNPNGSAGPFLNPPTGLSSVRDLYTNLYTVVALTTQGQIFCWGGWSERPSENYGQKCSSTEIPSLSSYQFKQIIPGESFFFGMTVNDGLIAWGGGNTNINVQPIASGVKQILVNNYKGAAILMSAGNVLMVGSTNEYTSSCVNCKEVYYNGDRVFLGIEASDNSIKCWGNTQWITSSNCPNFTDIMPGSGSIVSTSNSYCVLRSSSTIYCFGYFAEIAGWNDPEPLTNVQAIVAGTGHYVVLYKDGTVKFFGQASGGAGVTKPPTGLKNVARIYSANYCQVALRTDGTVAAWGTRYCNGVDTGIPNTLTNIVQVFTNKDSFCAIDEVGTATCWGAEYFNVPPVLSGIKVMYGTYTTNYGHSDFPSVGAHVYPPPGAWSAPMEIARPTLSPTPMPTGKPTTVAPSVSPTAMPSTNPTGMPSTNPTAMPSTNPTATPSANPTVAPSQAPTYDPISLCIAGEYYSNITSTCELCVEGKYNPYKGKTTCLPCPQGRASMNVGNRRVSDCELCSSGSFSTESGSVMCALCNAGYYSTIGATTCLPCPAGFFVLYGQTECQLCPAGKYSESGSSICTDCANGSFSLDGDTACVRCIA